MPTNETLVTASQRHLLIKPAQVIVYRIAPPGGMLVLYSPPRGNTFSNEANYLLPSSTGNVIDKAKVTKTCLCYDIIINPQVFTLQTAAGDFLFFIR